MRGRTAGPETIVTYPSRNRPVVNDRPVLISFTIMPNLTYITVYCRESDVERFKDVANTEAATELPGVWEVDIDEGEPYDLQEFKDIPFVGYHCGHQGDYDGAAFFCRGDGSTIEGHRADFGGFLSLIAPHEIIEKVTAAGIVDSAKERYHDALQFLSDYIKVATHIARGVDSDSKT